jgi:ABC-type Fe3+/spermidine/putrescine transport system ATPase subunit
MLELRRISKTYEGKPLLLDVSLLVASGETICLLGASGSGKSTLLRIIAGLESPEAGQVCWNGQEIASLPPHLRDFGLVFQDYALFPHLDVFDNVAFGLRMRETPKDAIETRVRESLELVNLRGFESRRVTELSGGEQQRVALARALAPRPRLLMFDEPLGALDRTLKDDLLHELRAILHRTKIPAIYVTHDQQEAFAIAQKVMLLHDGVIVQSGSPDEVRANPVNAWVADFLGVQSSQALQPERQNREILHSSPITVIKRNASGAETWRYTGKILRREADFVVLEAFFNHDDIPLGDTTLKRGDRFVETFFTGRWYNIFEIYDRDDGALKGWYCNIARPAIFEARDTLSYTDLALDLWVNPRHEMTVLDEDEFDALNLDPDVHQKALTTLENLKSHFPFYP